MSSDVIAEVRAAVDAAAGVDRSGWSGATRSTVLIELLAARERLDALVLAVAGEWDEDQAWAADGAASPVGWLAHRCPVTRQDASALVRTARHVTRHDATAKALDAGDISATHAAIAARAAKHFTDLYAAHEPVILESARSMPAAGFRRIMAHWQHCAADHTGNPEPDEGRWHLDAAVTFAGNVHGEMLLDPVGGAALLRVLDAMEPPDPADRPDGPRTVSQRRAAALIRLATGDQPPPVHVDILTDVDTIAGRAPTDLTTANCDICGHGPISPVLGRTLACDAAIGRVITRGRSEVLDIGRRTRLVTPALRRALDARDRGCVEPGCSAPAHWCDAHHIQPWWAHGSTSLDNLELRCRTHHLQQHQRNHERRSRRRRE